MGFYLYYLTINLCTYDLCSKLFIILLLRIHYFNPGNHRVICPGALSTGLIPTENMSEKETHLSILHRFRMNSTVLTPSAFQNSSFVFRLSQCDSISITSSHFVLSFSLNCRSRRAVMHSYWGLGAIASSGGWNLIFWAAKIGHSPSACSDAFSHWSLQTWREWSIHGVKESTKLREKSQVVKPREHL